jgi:selenophosphate synthetase-related protein
VEVWLDLFPSYAFLMCGPPERMDDCIAAFAERGLACAHVGAIDDTGLLRVQSGVETAVLLNDTSGSATGLSSPPRTYERR